MEWLPYRDDLRTICRTAYSRLTISPLKVMLQRVYKSFQDDRVFPNVHKEKVAVRHLRDGHPMLFLRAIEKPRRFDGIPRSVDVYAKLRDNLRAAGFDLALVIVPGKLTVYGPLLGKPRPRAWRAWPPRPSWSDQPARNITVVNLAQILAARARRTLEDTETLYLGRRHPLEPPGDRGCGQSDLRRPRPPPPVRAVAGPSAP